MPRRTSDDVADLFGRARAGDAAAWECLVTRLSVLPWSVARAHRLPEADSADVVQSTWLRLLENLDAVSNAERLPGWLATTARRECLRSLRRSGQVLPVDQLTAHDLPDERLEPLDAGLLRAAAGRTRFAAVGRVHGTAGRLPGAAAAASGSARTLV